MKYQFNLKRKSDGVITHTQYSDDVNYQMKIPEGWGFIHAGWYTEDRALALGLKLEDALETKIVVDNEYQQEIPSEDPDAEVQYETVQETHGEYRYNANYEVIPELVPDPTYADLRRVQYKKRIDPFVAEAVTDLAAGDSTKMDELVAEKALIKSEIPKDEHGF